MAAGDLLPTSGETYAAELRAYLMADTATFKIWRVGGLNGNKIKKRDTSIDGGVGAVGAADYLDAWVLSLWLRCSTGLPSTAELALVDLKEAWLPATEDLELHMWVPGLEHIKLLGRPDDLEPDRVFMPGGVITAQAMFRVLNAEVVTVEAP